MPIRHGFTALALAAFLVIQSQAQVQSNGPDASFLVQGQAGAGFSGTSPILAAANGLIGLEISGGLNQPFLAATGTAMEPGQDLGQTGVLNLMNPLILADGFAQAIYNTGPVGSVSFTASYGLFATGTELALQVAVMGPLGLRLAAPARIIVTPGDPLAAGLHPTLQPLGFPTGNRHAVIADVNGDGILDSVNSAGIWLGDGNFGFNFAAIDPGGAEAAVLDIIGDTHQDLVVLDNVFLGCKIFQGDGSGAFVGNPVVQLPVFCGDQSDVAIVDLDHDGDLDVLVADGETLSPGLTRFDNFGGGNFFLSGAFFDGSRSVTTADLDGDGNREIIMDAIPAIGGVAAAETRILWGTSNPSYSAGNSTVLSVMPEAGTRWIRAADMDGDGDMDLIWSGTTHQGIILNQGGGNFSYNPIPTAPLAGFAPPRIDISDFDSDGDMDLSFTQTDSQRSYLCIAINDGSGAIMALNYIPVAGTPTFPSAPAHALPADLDGDGKTDYFVGGSPASLIIN